jgi:site-specific DNA recombinase
MRVLAGIRVSRSTDESTSPERQLAAVQRWAESKAHQIVGQAVDLDVSGYKKAPWERPEIGGWLGQRAAEFDIVAWARLDRAVRRMADMSRLAEWAKQHQKTLAFCSGPGGTLVLDMSSGPVAELIAMVLAFAAELEAQSIQERVTDSRAYLRQVARFAGGWVPFGYRKVELPGGKGWVLEHDPVYAPMLTSMADDVIRGIPANQIAKRLNEAGIPTSRVIERLRNGILVLDGDGDNGSGDEATRPIWRAGVVIDLLRSRLACGITEYRGQVVRDADGLPKRFSEPIISDEKWRQVQYVLSQAGRPQSRRHNGALLLRVAYCPCGSPLYASRPVVRGKLYNYYRCYARAQGSGCPGRNISAKWLDEQAETIFLNQVGHVEILEKVTIPGDNHATELARIGQAMTDLVSERYVRNIVRDDYDALMARLETEHARLAALPAEPDRIEQRSTGRTFAELWEVSDIQERRRLMLDAGFLIGCGHTASGEVMATALDPDLARRAGLAAEGTQADVPYGTEELTRALSGSWAALCTIPPPAAPRL